MNHYVSCVKLKQILVRLRVKGLRGGGVFMCDM